MKKTRYKIRPLAETDLDNHARKIARDNVEAGVRLYDRAEETYEMLGDLPYMGAIYQTTRQELVGIRFAPIKEFPRYLVYYVPTKGHIEIIRILHARMDRDSWL